MWWTLVLWAMLGCTQASSQDTPQVFFNGTCCGRTCYGGMITCWNDTLHSCVCLLSNKMNHCIQLPPQQTTGCGEDMTCNSADQQCNCQIVNTHGQPIIVENITGSCVNLDPDRSTSTVPVSVETSSDKTVVSTILTPSLTTPANTTDHYGENTLFIAGLCVGGVVVVAVILTVPVVIHVFRRKRKRDYLEPPRTPGTYGNTKVTVTPEGASGLSSDYLTPIFNIQAREDSMTDAQTGARTYETLAVDRTSEESHNYTSVSNDYLTPAFNPPGKQKRGGNSHLSRTSPV